MTDPQRIVQGHAGALQTALLRSVRCDAPPAQAKARTLALLGLASGAAGAATLVATSAQAAVAAATATTKATSTAALVLTGKWVVIAFATATLAVGVARTINPSVPAPHASAAAAFAVVRPSPPTMQPLVPTQAAAVASNQPLPAVSVAPAVIVLPGKVANPTATSRAGDASRLAEEVAALDQARAAAAAHDPARALRLLNTYQRQFPQGALLPEAQVVRIEALVQSGQAAKALPIARQMLRADPTGPHAERIRALLPAADSNEPMPNIRSDSADPATSQ